MTFKEVLYEIFSEPGQASQLSWGRVASGVALLGAVIWISKIVFQTHTLPAFDGITAFVLAPYASNKAATAVQTFANKP